MGNHRTRSLPRLDISRVAKYGSISYLSFGLVALVTAAFAYPYIEIFPHENAGSVYEAAAYILPVVLWIFNMVGMALVYLLIRNCRLCRLGQAGRITTALDKMCKGDLGWKITLRRGDELTNVADSVTRASKSLAVRISKLQAKSKELSSVEEYLLDSIDADSNINPYTLKALRKMKICTSRLLADLEDFQVSNLNQKSPKMKPTETKESIPV